MSNKSGQLLPCVISKDMSLRLDLLKFLSCLAVIYAHSYSPQYAFFNAAVKPFPLIDNIEKIFALYIASVTVPRSTLNLMEARGDLGLLRGTVSNGFEYGIEYKIYSTTVINDFILRFNYTIYR